ncbi:GxxExxY protein [Chryseobacterium indoltheticum]|uniref:GxxExxY protein n=1 Tax=Chryseobacterium indoltheticum TaxID=254 RepID=UPI0028ED949D|nr:GxxExxY protein [Chryseobacterium indoltheticum]
MTENELSYKIIGAALEVRKTLGVGLLENVYEVALAYELKELGLKVESQLVLPLKYKNETISNAYRIDLMVENKIIIEIKSVLELHPVFYSQVLTYLKPTNIKLGLQINFNTPLIKNGIHRIVNKL